ncbi:MAG: alpha/beta fold hydrolase [Flavisolibacter sp.]
MRKTVNILNRNISYKIIGEGPLVVLLHGFGEDSSIWNHQVKALKDYRLLIPDLPGTGNSEMTADMSLEGMAESIKNLVALEQNLHAGSADRRFSLLGHSMGGYITLAFAEQYPNLLNGFGLIHSTAYADSPEKILTRRKGMEFVEKHGAYEFLKTSIPNLYAPLSKENHPEWIEEHLNDVRNFSGAALVNYYDSMIKRPDRTEILKTTELPVLFILGKYDNAVPLKDGLEQCYLPSLSYIDVLYQSGHMGMIEETTKTNESLTKYLMSIHHQTR